MLTFKNYNIADWVSFYRIAAAPFLILLLSLGARDCFAWLLLVSYTSDAVDGFIARTLKINSPRGSQLDSFGDQITFVIGILGLWIFERGFIHDNLLIIIVAFVPYIIQMIIAYLKYEKATAFHTYLAKLSAVVQSVFILSALFFEPRYDLFYTMIVIGLLETIEEITLIFMLDKWTSDIKGVYWALKRKKTSKK